MSAAHTGQGWTGKVSFLQDRQGQNLRGGADREGSKSAGQGAARVGNMLCISTD